MANILKANCKIFLENHITQHAQYVTFLFVTDRENIGRWSSFFFSNILISFPIGDKAVKKRAFKTYFQNEITFPWKQQQRRILR